MNTSRTVWTAALAVYAAGVVCVFLILHGFTGGVWGDMPPVKEVVFALAWPLVALWILVRMIF